MLSAALAALVLCSPVAQITPTWETDSAAHPAAKGPPREASVVWGRVLPSPRTLPTGTWVLSFRIGLPNSAYGHPGEAVESASQGRQRRELEALRAHPDLAPAGAPRASPAPGSDLKTGPRRS